MDVAAAAELHLAGVGLCTALHWEEVSIRKLGGGGSGSAFPAFRGIGPSSRGAHTSRL